MTVILIDAKNCMFRFGWVHRNLTATNGQHTGAVYGILGILLRLKKKYQDAKFVAVWDGDNRQNGWRYKLYPDYKRRVGEIPQETQNTLGQISTVKTMLKLVGIGQIEVSEIEADDVIGILAIAMVGHWPVIIYSSDCDFVQLQPYSIMQIRDVDKTDKLCLESSASVLEKFRCAPKDVLKVRAICGDKSDNIPGVFEGVGPVRAAQLVAAGVNPEKSWEQQPYAFRQLASREHWKQVQRNYKLMKLPVSPRDASYTGEQQARLELGCAEVWKYLQSKIHMGDYESMCQMFGELDLKQAMTDRQEIWKLGL